MVRNETTKKIKCTIAYNKNSKFLRNDRYKPYNCETVAKKRAPNTKNALPLYATALLDELTSSVPRHVVQIDTLYLSTLTKRFFAIGRPQLDETIFPNCTL